MMIRNILTNENIQKIYKDMEYKGQRLLAPFEVENGLSYVGKWSFIVIKNYLFFFEREITSFMFLDKFDKGETNIIFAICEKYKKSYMIVYFWDSKLEDLIEIGRIDFEILDYRDPERILKCFDKLFNDFYKIENKIYSNSDDYILQVSRKFMELIKKCIINNPDYDNFLHDKLISFLTNVIVIKTAKKMRERAIEWKKMKAKSRYKVL